MRQTEIAIRDQIEENHEKMTESFVNVGQSIDLLEFRVANVLTIPVHVVDLRDMYRWDAKDHTSSFFKFVFSFATQH